MKFAYADPPYLGNAKKYKDLHPQALDWDVLQTHLDLIKRLDEDYPEGWALSCNPKDLSWLLPVCTDVRVCCWAKTFHQIRPTTVQFAWEAVILKGGRKDNKRKPMVRDWLACARTNKRGCPGAKPLLFNRWILDLLNFQKDDVLDDLFPGSGGMAMAEVEHLKGKGNEDEDHP